MRSRDASIIVVVTVLASAFSFAITILPENVRATTLYVGGVGPGNFTSIQGAIDAASPGSRIFVFNGTYFENIVITKTLSLAGEDRNSTIVVGNPSIMDVIQIVADWVNVSGFTATGSEVGIELDYVHDCYIANNTAHSNEYVGISIYHSDNNTISDVNAFWNYNWSGVLLYRSDDNIVTHSNLSNNGNAIWLQLSDDNTFSNNYARSNTVSDIFVSSSVGATITDNDMTGGIFIEWADTVDPFDRLEYWNSHSIDTSNSVNGNPVHYWTNATGGRIPNNAGQVIIANCTDVIVENQNLSGGPTGIIMAYSSNNRIANNTVFGRLYDGFTIYRSSENSIKNNSLKSNGRDGIYLHKSDKNDIDGNTVSSNDWSGIHLPSSQGNIISTNTIFSNGEHGIRLSIASDDNSLIGNTISSNTEMGIYSYYADNNVIQWNNVTGNELGIRLDMSHGNTITHNTAHNNTPPSLDGVGIGFTHSNDNVMSNNIVYSNGGIGLTSTNSRNFTVSDNVAYDHVGWGMLFYGSEEFVVSNNTAFSNLREGIEITESNHVVVVNNTASFNGWGMGTNIGENITFYNNTANFNAWGGIGLGWDGNNTVVNNTSIGNGQFGIFIGWSNDNRIYHNTILGNARQGWDNSTFNYWDNGYPSGGNYWGDYSGVDLYNGPNQNLPGSDGIGDTPYNIPGGIQRDRYPLMAPSGPVQTVPSAPRNLGTVGGNQLVALNWTEPLYDGNSPITNYRIYRGDVSGGEVFLVEIGNLTAYLDTGLTNGQTYYYIVSAVNAVGGGPDSNEAYATPTIQPVLPSEPRNLLAVAGSGNISLTWNPPLFDGNCSIIHYRVFRGIASGGETYLGELGNVTIFKDFGLTNGQEYFYQVSVVNLVGEGPRSNEASATPTVPPQPPTMMQADLVGEGAENVSIVWTLSLDDGSGQNSVVGYAVRRSTSYDFGGLGYGIVGNVPKGETQFIDHLAGEGNPNDYFYFVCAIDLNNLSSCSTNQAGKFTRNLSEGVNLASIPLVQSDESVARVLQTVKFDKAWTHLASGNDDPWKSYMTFKPYKGDLKTVDHRIGIWINVTEDSNLTIAGLVPSFTDINLEAGWNLVTFPSFHTSYSVSDLKAETGATRVEGFDSQAPPYDLRVMNDGEFLQAGHSYWIYVGSGRIWTVTNS
jgi:parallel beta-helix repeat protein